MASTYKVLRKDDILKKMVTSYGMDWTQARKAYATFCEIIGDAVIEGQMITVGKVLTIKPVWKDPRVVSLNCGRVGKGNKIEKTQKRFYLGRRLKYVVNLHASFMNKRDLNWFKP